MVKEGISVYPNPANQLIQLTSESNIQYEVLDLSGKVLTSGNNIMETQIDCKEWPSGIYLVRTMNETGIQVFKVMVSH